jgi:hypothetical protein
VGKPDVPEKLRFVLLVTRKHGDTFASSWFEIYEAMWDAFGESGVMEWPQDEDAQHRYKVIEDEILEKTFEAAKDAISEAFVRVANEVLSRERFTNA